MPESFLVQYSCGHIGSMKAEVDSETIDAPVKPASECPECNKEAKEKEKEKEKEKVQWKASSSS